MSKLTKNQKAVLAKYDKTKVYSLPEACALLKEITYTKFDASVEITTNLVNLVYKTDTRHAIFVGLAPDSLRLGFDTHLTVKDNDGTIEHTK